MKTFILLLTLCLTVSNVNAQKIYSKSLIDRGIWLRVDLDGGLKDSIIDKNINKAFALINKENKAIENANPWVGLNLQLTWGHLHNGTNYNKGINRIKSVLNRAEREKYFVQLSLTDKYQSDVKCTCNANDCEDNYFKGPIPKIKNTRFKALDHVDFDTLKTKNRAMPNKPYICKADTVHYEAYRIPNGIEEPKYRYARQQNVDRKEEVFGKDNAFRRKYFSVRWNKDVEEEWLSFWKLLAENIGQHPALRSIITPESSNSINSQLKKVLLEPGSETKVKKKNILDYPGGKEYVNYLVKMSRELRKYFPNDVLIVNNTNWIFPNLKHENRNAKGNPNSYFQKDAADGYLEQNSILKNPSIGWCAQDIVLRGSLDSYYKRHVYTQLMRFPEQLRFGFISGESKLSEVIPEDEIPARVLGKIKDFGISNIVFITKFNEIKDLIRKAKPGDYPFMPDADAPKTPRLKEKTDYFIVNKATKAYLKLKFDNNGNPSQQDLVVTDADNAYNSAKWQINYDDRFDPEGFQIVNKRNNEIIKYKAGGTNARKVVRDTNTNTTERGSYWKLIPAESDGYFHLENSESGKILKHDNATNQLVQTNFKNGKAEWTFVTSKLPSAKYLTVPTKNNELLVYPNPTSQTLQIHKSSIGGIKIYDINGKLIKSYMEDRTTIDVSNFAKGIYYLKVNNSVRKFIKQ